MRPRTGTDTVLDCCEGLSFDESSISESDFPCELCDSESPCLIHGVISFEPATPRATTSVLPTIYDDEPLLNGYRGEPIAENLCKATFDSALLPPRKKALLIGVSYARTPRASNSTQSPPALRGTHEDVDAMKAFLIEYQNWPESCFTVLKDDPALPEESQPTKANILKEMRNLVEEAKVGAELFLHFSGHGSQIPDLDNDEVDGMDEVIWASDGLSIIDDDMHEQLVRRLPPGTRMTAIFDCCSSGTALDLPLFPDDEDDGYYPSVIFSPNEVYESPTSIIYPTETTRSVSQDTAFMKKVNDLKCAPIPDRFTTGERPAVRRKYSSGDVVMWAACRDGEKSQEVWVWDEGKQRGAMTQAFIESLKSNAFEQCPTYHGLLDAIRGRMKSYGLGQNVVLSSSRELDVHTKFSL